VDGDDRPVSEAPPLVWVGIRLEMRAVEGTPGHFGCHILWVSALPTHRVIARHSLILATGTIIEFL
jgi:hypothetical protein